MLPCYPNEQLFEEPQISVVLLREPMLFILPTWQCPLCDSFVDNYVAASVYYRHFNTCWISSTQFNWAYLSSSELFYLSSSVPTSVQLRLPQFIWAYLSSTEATSVHLSLPQFNCSTEPTSVHLCLRQFNWGYLSSYEPTSVHLSLSQFICAYVSSTEATSVHLSLLQFNWAYLSSSEPISFHLSLRQFNWGYLSSREYWNSTEASFQGYE